MRSAGALLLVLCATAPAHAQSDGRARAEVLAREANDLYESGSFAQAAVMLERAYAAYPIPVLLFNRARALEADGDLVRAIDAYQRYLTTAQVNDLQRREIELTIEDLERRVEAARATPDPPDLTRPPDDHEPAPPPPPREPPYGAFVVGGIGLGLIVVAIGFGASAWSIAADVESDPTLDAVVSQDLINTAQTFAAVANVFYVLGGLAALGGTIWAIVDLSSGPGDGAEAHLRVGPGGVAIDGRF